MCYHMLFCSVQIQKATPDENQLVVLSCFFGNCHSDEVFRILGHTLKPCSILWRTMLYIFWCCCLNVKDGEETTTLTDHDGDNPHAEIANEVWSAKELDGTNPFLDDSDKVEVHGEENEAVYWRKLLAATWRLVWNGMLCLPVCSQNRYFFQWSNFFPLQI